MFIRGQRIARQVDGIRRRLLSFFRAVPRHSALSMYEYHFKCVYCINVQLHGNDLNEILSFAHIHARLVHPEMEK